MNIKNIFILLAKILGILVILFFILWFLRWFIIFIPDAKENQERGKSFYKELSVKYEMSGGYPFKMNYTYDMKTNMGFFSGGGYIGADCWERYIRDAWSNQDVVSVSLCAGEEITKEKLETIEEFWKKREEVFKK